VGIDSRRLHFFNLSAAMGPRWAEICTEFTQEVQKLGPSPIWLCLKKKKTGGEDVTTTEEQSA
jgi:hypothetical protein